MSVKRMEHIERLQDKYDAQEKYRQEVKRKSVMRTLLIVLGSIAAFFAVIVLITIYGSAMVKQQEQELQAIVEQIMIDIENENFVAAYVKVNSLYWDDSWTSDGEEKWDSIREEVTRQIEKAEKELQDSVNPSGENDEKESLWDRLFR